MKDHIKKRVKEIAKVCIATGGTVRTLAEVCMTSKSTVHKDLTERLKEIDKSSYKKVKAILAKNKSERHIRGGEATRKKYLTKKMEESLL